MSNYPTRWVELNVTLGAGEFVANDALGERLEFVGALRDSNNGGVLQAVVINAPNTQTPAIDLIFFDDVFQATASNAVMAPTDEDMRDKWLGGLQLLAGEWITFANNGGLSRPVIGWPIQVKNSPGTLYGQMVTRTTFTPGPVVYTVKLGFLKD